ncbi:MAG: hypothetical protein CL610_03480 [Anaerolineaceae bacterium]|nr:hypothetical protein [Anaerolineaceae bacterium]
MRPPHPPSDPVVNCTYSPSQNQPRHSSPRKNSIRQSCQRLIFCIPGRHLFVLRLAFVFLLIALLAAVFGFGSAAGTAASIAQLLFLVFLVLFIVAFILGRRPTV